MLKNGLGRTAQEHWCVTCRLQTCRWTGMGRLKISAEKQFSGKFTTLLTFIVLVDFVLPSSLHVCSLQLLRSVSYFYLSWALSIVEQVCLSCINKYCANVGIQLFHVLLILIVVNVSTASTNIVPVLLVPCALLVLLVFNVDSVSIVLINVVPVSVYSFQSSQQWSMLTVCLQH